MKKNNFNNLIMLLFFIIFILIVSFNIFNYQLSKDINNIIYNNKIIYKLNDKGFTYKFKRRDDYKEQIINIEKKSNNIYSIILTNYLTKTSSCSSMSKILTKDIYLIKNTDTSYILQIFKNNSMDFYDVYQPIYFKNLVCNYDIDFIIENILKTGDTVYVFDKNVIIKELIVP